MEENSEEKTKNFPEGNYRVVFKRHDQSYWEKCLNGSWQQVFPPFPDGTSIQEWENAPV